MNEFDIFEVSPNLMKVSVLNGILDLSHCERLLLNLNEGVFVETLRGLRTIDDIESVTLEQFLDFSSSSKIGVNFSLFMLLTEIILGLSLDEYLIENNEFFLSFSK